MIIRFRMVNGLKFMLIPLVLAGALVLFHDTEVRPGPGVVAPDDPVQVNLRSASPIQRGDYTITPLATFDITARILGTERYRFDRGADLSPLDLAMGWGRMSDSAVLDRISISQSGRWYYWRTPEYPIPRKEIIYHSANMHMIPADDTVKTALLDLKKGQVVHLTGMLVSVSRSDGWRWRSSMTRKDSGSRACELVWVDTVSVEVPVDPD